MTLHDILDKALSRVDEELSGIDDTALKVVKNAVGQAYMEIRSAIDRRIKTVNVPAANPVSMPANSIEVVRVRHSKDGEYAKSEYYQEGDQLYFFPEVPKGTLELSFVEAPALPDDSADPKDVEISVKDQYVHAIITFAAYAYQVYRRKYSAAQMLLQEFNSFIGGWRG